MSPDEILRRRQRRRRSEYLIPPHHLAFLRRMAGITVPQVMEELEVSIHTVYNLEHADKSKILRRHGTEIEFHRKLQRYVVFSMQEPAAQLREMARQIDQFIELEERRVTSEGDGDEE